jgi:hypothetical protein
MNTIPATTRLFAASMLAVAFAAANICGTTAHAAEAAHEHGHAAAAKPLPAGKRWASDATLRGGMTNIRGAFAPKLAAIHGDKLPPADYKALAETTEKEVAGIVANCKLSPDADAALHGILAQIGEGTDAMAGRSKLAARDGAVMVVEALDRYGATFNHPGWKRLHG